MREPLYLSTKANAQLLVLPKHHIAYPHSTSPAYDGNRTGMLKGIKGVFGPGYEATRTHTDTNKLTVFRCPSVTPPASHSRAAEEAFPRLSGSRSCLYLCWFLCFGCSHADRPEEASGGCHVVQSGFISADLECPHAYLQSCWSMAVTVSCTNSR